MRIPIPICLLLLLAAVTQAADWPQHCRDEVNNSVTSDSGPDSFNLLWEVGNGDDVQTSPAVVGDRVYWADEGAVVTCADRETGDVIWQRDLSGYGAGMVDSSPAVAGDRLFIGGGYYSQYLFCLDLETGDKLWQADLHDDVIASPTVAGDRVYIGSNMAYFACLDFEGNEEWYWEDSNEQIWGKAAVDLDEQRVYFGTLDGRVYCLPLDDPDASGDITGGEVLWTYETEGGVNGPPTLWGFNLYVTDLGGHVYCLDASEGTLNWQWNCTAAIYGGVTVSGSNRAYFGCRDDRLYCLDAYTGDYHWSFETDGGNIDCTPTLAGGRVYFGAASSDWALYCLDASDGDLLWTEGDHLYADSSPTVVDGLLYIGTNDGDINNVLAVSSASGQCTTQGTWSASDAFPANGDVDLVTLGNNAVRFDMAASIAVPGTYVNDPGDSIVVRVTPAWGDSAVGADLVYHASLNPLFAASRTSGWPADSVVAGWRVGDALWAFDLPDSGFLFPGDVVHYRIEAGFRDGPRVVLPPDTTGFACLPGDPAYDPAAYPPEYTVCCLPSLWDAAPDACPPILLWIDTHEREVGTTWLGTLGRLGFRPHVDYDLFWTTGAAEGVGNGLGGRASPPQLDHYRTVLYASGSCARFTLGCPSGNGDVGDDVALLTSWLQAGSRHLLLSGGHLASDLAGRGAPEAAFLEDVMAVDVTGTDVASLIGFQSSPTAAALAGNPVLSAGRWLLLGGTAGLRTFDAVEAAGPGQRLAEYLSAAGGTGIYPEAAAVRSVPAPFDPYGLDDEVVTLPYDLSRVPEDVTTGGRQTILDDVLTFFGHLPGGSATSAPPPEPIVLNSRPNPFNPSLVVSWTLPQAGPLALQVHDLRGRLVRVLHDGPAPAGPGSIVWDGRDDSNKAVASGVFVVRALAGGRTLTRKVSLVR